MDYPELGLTHCVKDNAPSVMANVPLFALSMDSTSNFYLNTALNKSNFDRVSHFNIFSTSLIMMGYEPKEVRLKYGQSFQDDLSNQKRIFTSGDLFGRSQFYFNNFDQ